MAKRQGRLRIGDLMQRAVQMHQAGNLEDAIEIYGKVLEKVPAHPDALHYLGIAYHQSGDSATAVEKIEASIQAAPDRADFLGNLAKIRIETGTYEAAEKSLKSALSLDPQDLQARLHYIVLLRETERFGDALTMLDAARKIEPGLKNYHRQRGEILQQSGDFAAAVSAYEQHLLIDPNDTRAHSNVGFCLEQLGRTGEAMTAYRRAFDTAGESEEFRAEILRSVEEGGDPEAAIQSYLQQMENDPEDWHQHAVVGRTLGRLGRMEAAIRVLQKIVELNPDSYEAWNDAGSCLNTLNRIDLAAHFYAKAIELDPGKYPALNNLGNAFMGQHRYDLAIKFYKEALQRAPRAPGPHVNLIRSLRHLNRYDEANFYAHATLTLDDLEPGHRCNPFQIFQATCDFEGLRELGDLFGLTRQFHTSGQSAVFLDLLVHARTDDQLSKLFSLHKGWADNMVRASQASPLPEAKLRTRDKGRKIRVGVLSSDLKGHSVARFVGPILLNYDKSGFEFYCYTPERAPNDPLQKKFIDHVDRFTFVDGMSEREIAEAIRRDDVDILIELNGFAMSHKLEVLAYKPAPVQICWLGYPYTTGMETVDFLVTDPYVKPVREDLLAEKPLVLPESWVCFDSFEDVPINPVIPFERNGIITFGTLNNTYKYTPETIGLWGQVMSRVPDSRFLVVRPEIDSVVLKTNLVREFEKHGIGPERLYFVNNKKIETSHLDFYNEIDISLDTFPLTGGTTTCEAVWMGVPVVTKVGPGMHQRMSHSILNNVSLGELSVGSDAEFIDAAVELAQNPDSITFLRHHLRPMVQQSALCRIDDFVGNFQAALRVALKEKERTAGKAAAAA